MATGASHPIATPSRPQLSWARKSSTTLGTVPDVSIPTDPGGKVSVAPRVAQNHRTLVRRETRLIWPPVQSSVQRVDIYVEHKNRVEYVQELMEVAGAPAEEGGRMSGVSGDGPDLFNRPDPMRVTPNDAVHTLRRSFQRLAGLGVPNTGQGPITMDDMKTTLLQLSFQRRSCLRSSSS